MQTSLASPIPYATPSDGPLPGPGFRPRRLSGLKVLGSNSQGQVVVLDPESPNWALLPPSVAQFLSACDGTRTLSELGRGFRFGADGPGGPGLGPVVRRLQDLGVLEGVPAAGPSTTDCGPAPLGTLALYLTRACNLRCRYCFLSAGKPYQDELTTGEYRDLLDQGAELGVGVVQWLGGEPLMRPDLFEIAAHGRQLGLSQHLLTNGTLVTPESAARVREHFEGVQVSLDGMEEVNDRFRNRGSFRRTVAGIRTLLDAGNPVVVSCVVSRHNIDQMDEFFEFMAGLGVRSLHFMNLQKCGRGRNTCEDGVSTYEFAYRLTELWRRWQDTFVLPLPKLLKLPRFERKLNCSPGNGVVEIDPCGRVFPCYYFMEAGEAAGSVRNARLADIYYGSEHLARLRRVSVDDREPCRSCDYRYLCGGGCMGENEPSAEFCEDTVRLIHYILFETQELLAQQERAQMALEGAAATRRPSLVDLSSVTA
ncbi:MAG: radical SAM protein [Gammaproteobacteria bacterium]|jgi:radical SAM protein with 4Fe4S-binding SPASM domain|nr:radical SAM protein [Gammaproteobacteria bacterium]